ncbi:DedA family protein [Isoptericola variabilis]|uniref:SNARE associated Golgi protein n=1 Tax=Isoptericola variabilis (strain 225) TaxID=743718 RepID=F6FXH2_ISOV2|nr:VTT domain-containing protein [Isoptericola variabilis]AEG44700.1 SNARE associated Golgi protein [Isoptericola variabilis 225]TWH33441.1 membrane protein DedA with SNARE-associated domain [Isoptericola variabilis J7]
MGDLLDVPGELTAAAGEAGVFTIAGVPYWVVYLAAFGIVLVRAQATYWAGRGVARGTARTRLAERLSSPRAVAWVERVHRWGPPAVTLSFFTVGIQTVVNLAAGYLRMPYPRYLAALLVGCAAWAAIWTTVGTAAVNGAVALAARSPLTLAVLGAGLVASLAWAAVRARRRREALRDA